VKAASPGSGLIEAYFKNAFEVRPFSGAATAALDFSKKRGGTFIPASIAVAEEGHTSYFENVS
jgi:hypothetical protein